MRSQLTRFGSVAIVAMFVAGACGGGGSKGDHVAKIGVVAPLNAGLTKFGRGIRNGVLAAVDEANKRHAIPGWKLEVDPRDDSSNPGTGEAAAKQLAAEKNVIGVVGTYNSGVAAKVAPVLSGAGIVMISPGNTDAALTRGSDAANPQRPNATYFRLVAGDNVQGPFLAKAAFEDEHAKRVAVVSQTKPVSKGLADAFVAAFTGQGGSVVFNRVVPDDARDFTDVAKAIAPLHPDLVFFGGEYDAGAPLAKALRAAGVTVAMMGGDGIKDDALISEAGPDSDGVLASTVGAPVSNIPTAKPFTDAYAAGHYADPASDFGIYAYDAANVIIAAAGKALSSASAVNAKVRQDIVAAVQATNATGASGKLGFDQFGDTATKVFTLYRVSNGAWAPVKTGPAP